MKTRKTQSHARQMEIRYNRRLLIILVVLTLIFLYTFWRLDWRLDKIVKSQITEASEPLYTIITDQQYQSIEEKEYIDVSSDQAGQIYADRELPVGSNGRFKSYMSYKAITNKSSRQWHLQQLAETDPEGFRVFNGKYLVAMGTYYSDQVGSEFKITLEDGKVFNVMIGDVKQDIHTDPKNQYVEGNGNILEFIVDIDKLDPVTKRLGDVSNSGLAGAVVKIEEIIY